MKKYIVLAVFFLWQAAFGLQAPYLYSADSVADTAVQLTWRNNSVDYQGVIILRKSVAAGQYTVIDTAPGSATSFTDTDKPPSQVTYYYALTAYSLTEHADTSNVDSARITPVPFDSIFVAPQNYSVLWFAMFNAVGIGFFDSSNVETGYRIYRSTNFGSFEMIKDLISSTPSTTGYLSYMDSTISSKTWYTYYVVEYKGQQTLSSDTDIVFTFNVDSMKRDSPKKCTLLDKIGSFPINYGTWSLKSGDTIVFNESNAPDSTFSIIDVSIPSQPKFAGLGKSGAAVIFYYPSKRALYSYTKGDYVFKPTGDSLSCYKYHSGTMQNLSAINIGRTVLPPCGFLSDTVLIVPNLIDTGYGRFGSVSYLWAGEVLFKNNTLSYSKEELVYKNSCGPQSSCDYSYIPALASGVLYQGRLFVGIPGGSGMIQTMEIFDFNYPIPPKTVLSVNYYNDLTFFDIQSLSNGISLDAPALAADSHWINSKARSILIDTVKNLAFVLSDSVLSIYNCHIVTGISNNFFFKPPSLQFLRIGQEKGNSGCIIFLPRHSHPVDVSIFTMSGRLAYRFTNVSGESITWRRGNKTGVYLIKTVIDGQEYSAKTILTK